MRLPSTEQATSDTEINLSTDAIPLAPAPDALPPASGNGS